MKRLLQLGALSCVAISSFIACAVAPYDESTDESAAYDDENVDTVSQAIENGRDVPVGSKYAKTTVTLGYCTGTIISPYFVLTAAHCNAKVGHNVGFYEGSQFSGVTRSIMRIWMPYGVSSSDLIDNDGKFADYALLQLSSAIPAGYVPAKIAARWPGNGVAVTQVGQGAHDNYPNPEMFLRYRGTYTYSSNNNDGHVLVETVTHDGDSGGPIYTSWGNTLEVHGDDFGNVLEWAWHGKYTSTAFHFWDIARALGILTSQNWDYIGNDLGYVDNVSVAECASRCLVDNACNAYTVVPNAGSTSVGRCWLKSGRGTGGRAASGMLSGMKSWTTCQQDKDGICRL